MSLLEKLLASVNTVEYGKTVKNDAGLRSSAGLADYVEQSLRLQSLSELHLLCREIKQHFGFDFFAFGLLLPCAAGRPVLYHLYDRDCDWIQHYIHNKFMLKDPFVKHCAIRITPNIWRNSDRDENLTEDEYRIMHETRDFGAKNIISIPCHGGYNEKGIFRVSCFGEHAISKEDIVHIAPQITLLSRYLQEALFKIARGPCGEVPVVTLTKREREVLSWVAQGKDSWAVGEILKISENTVLTHMKHIHEKLRVTSRQHAVAKALMLKLI